MPVPGQAGVRRKENGRKILASVCLDRIPCDLGQPVHFFLALPVGGVVLFAGTASLAAPFAALAYLMLPKMSGRFPWLHMIRYCWAKVIVLLVIQYTIRPLAKLPIMNMNTQGIQAKIEA